MKGSVFFLSGNKFQLSNGNRTTTSNRSTAQRSAPPPFGRHGCHAGGRRSTLTVRRNETSSCSDPPSFSAMAAAADRVRRGAAQFARTVTARPSSPAGAHTAPRSQRRARASLPLPVGDTAADGGPAGSHPPRPAPGRSSSAEIARVRRSTRSPAGKRRRWAVHRPQAGVWLHTTGIRRGAGFSWLFQEVSCFLQHFDL